MDCKNPIVMTYGLGRRKSGTLFRGWQFTGFYNSLVEKGYFVTDSALSRIDAKRQDVIFNADKFYKSGDLYDGCQMLVPCGNCVACRIARSREWATRCVLEARAYGDNNCFITLTYSDEFLPKDKSLDKAAFQKFMKRLRKNSGKKIRYYMCGEYGELYHRPHFHACLFGFKPDDLQLFSVNNGVKLFRSPLLEKCWKFGFVTVGEVTYQSAAYCARYVLKKMTGVVAESHYHGRLPEYNNMSLKPGIGMSYFERYGEECYQRGFVVIRDGIKAKIPRYFDEIYDRYYGDHAFEQTIKPDRMQEANAKFERDPWEYSIDRVLARAEAKEVSAKQRYKRKMEESL